MLNFSIIKNLQYWWPSWQKVQIRPTLWFSHLREHKFYTFYYAVSRSHEWLDGYWQIPLVTESRKWYIWKQSKLYGFDLLSVNCFSVGNKKLFSIVELSSLSIEKPEEDGKLSDGKYAENTWISYFLSCILYVLLSFAK